MQDMSHIAAAFMASQVPQRPHDAILYRGPRNRATASQFKLQKASKGLRSVRNRMKSIDFAVKSSWLPLLRS